MASNAVAALCPFPEFPFLVDVTLLGYKHVSRFENISLFLFLIFLLLPLSDAADL